MIAIRAITHLTYELCADRERSSHFIPAKPGVLQALSLYVHSTVSSVCGGGEKRMRFPASETGGVLYGTLLLRNWAVQQLSSAPPAGCCMAIVK